MVDAAEVADDFTLGLVGRRSLQRILIQTEPDRVILFRSYSHLGSRLLAIEAHQVDND